MTVPSSLSRVFAVSARARGSGMRERGWKQRGKYGKRGLISLKTLLLY